MSHPLRIGTRGSRLALWQAEYVAQQLRPLAGPRQVELVPIETAGDVRRDAPLWQLGGQGVFTKEIQRALLDRRVDVAVHSLKDLPTWPVEGLILAAVPPRGPSGDVFLSKRYASLAALPPGAVVATGSLRRRALLLHRRPDLRLVELRGNVETRLRKLSEEPLDAMVLAEAGLERLGLAQAITERLDPCWMVPAVGQGALGLECRQDDAATRYLVQRLDDPPTRAAVTAERAMLSALGGGCHVPIGGMATIDGDILTLRGCVLTADGQQRVDGSCSGSVGEAEAVGRRLAEQLLAQGAGRWLAGGS
ncbi:MAG: hydroxymethylbilane synthase [Gemmataceae bacterium]|nr:hydroxymethylbilane synthase [Gemmataceae bacterium]MDW8265913.1 hydroxymethylbilane synthase [Gemmataceae bacterium]